MSSKEGPTQPRRIVDIRERGFSDRVPVDEATEWVDAHSAKLMAEAIDIGGAAGRVLADPIEAPRAIPTVDRAGVDGYAVRSGDTVGAGDYNPLALALCECDDELPPNTAATIAAGAPLPRGADAILPFESARASGKTLEVFGPVAVGSGVERKGWQIQAGVTLLEGARVLLPQDIGLIASFGIQHVKVIRRPRVRLIVSSPKPDGKLNPPGDANGPMLGSLLARDGAAIEAQILGTGQREAFAGTLSAPGADVILVAGRTATGRDDETPLVVAEIGELAIHGIALRPGGSAGMGVVGTTPVLLLPGDPLACLYAYEVLAGRFVRRLAGRSPELPYPVREVEVGRKIVSGIGIVDVHRVCLVNGRAEPLGSAESGGLASAVRADGFVIVPAPLEGYAPGARVPVYMYGAAKTS